MAKPCHTTCTPASCSPLRNTPTMSAPTSVPSTAPRPPNRLVPPSTTAVMESRLYSVPTFGLAEASRPMRIQAPIA